MPYVIRTGTKRHFPKLTFPKIGRGIKSHLPNQETSFPNQGKNVIFQIRPKSDPAQTVPHEFMTQRDGTVQRLRYAAVSVVRESDLRRRLAYFL